MINKPFTFECDNLNKTVDLSEEEVKIMINKGECPICGEKLTSEDLNDIKTFFLSIKKSLENLLVAE